MQNVVIIGGGAAGVTLVQALAPKLNPQTHQLVLISEREYMAHLIAGLRVNVTTDGDFDSRMFFGLDRLFKPTTRPGRFVHARVERVDGAAKKVYLHTGEAVPYVALVFATGYQWPKMLDFAPRLEDTLLSVQSWREKFERARSVLIIGGGAVGTELAGEVKEFFPETEVTLVHSQSLLLNDAYTHNFRNKWTQQVQAAGVKLVLDDLALDLPKDLSETVSGPVKTQKGRTIQADLVVIATGPRPDPTLAATLDPSIVTPSGHIKVDPTLQVRGHPGVFALGDVIDWVEQKQAGKVPAHAAVVVPNLLAALKGEAPHKEYKSGTEGIFLTFGKNQGLGQLPFFGGLPAPSWLVAAVKGKGLLTSMSAKVFA